MHVLENIVFFLFPGLYDIHHVQLVTDWSTFLVVKFICQYNEFYLWLLEKELVSSMNLLLNLTEQRRI